MNIDEIRQMKFRRKLRGYDPQEVSAYLEQLGEHISEQDSQIQALKRTSEELKAELKEYRDRKQTLEATLAQTREAAEELKQNAEREAQLMVAEAELQAEKLLSQAHSRLAQIHDDITELKRQRAQFDVRLRSLVEAHLKLLDVEGDRDRELAELEDKIKILRKPNS